MSAHLREAWAALQVQFEVETNVPMRGVSRGGRRLWAIVDGQKAGSIVYKETGAMGAHLGMIEVSPNFRRSGIATALMDRFLQMYPYIGVTPWTDDGQEFWDSYRADHPGVREPNVGFVSSKTASDEFKVGRYVTKRDGRFSKGTSRAGYIEEITGSTALVYWFGTRARDYKSTERLEDLRMVTIDGEVNVDPSLETEASKTASLRKGPGVFWRAHPKGRPFEVGGGSSQIQFSEDERKTLTLPEPLTRVAEGYSSFSDPGHLWQYAVEMGWADDGGDWLADPIEMIGFEGKIVGSGWDGEPTVRPTSQPFARMSWAEFDRQVGGDIWTAGEWYNGINMPVEAKTASTWRGFVNGDSPFWKQHDFTIATQMRGRERYYEVWVLGENFRNFPRLAEAKAAVEAEVGPLTWNQVTMPLEEVFHYYFGRTTEFTDPLTIYWSDLW